MSRADILADIDRCAPPFGAAFGVSEPGFCAELAEQGVEVARGVFGARMLVEIENDGPVTILLET